MFAAVFSVGVQYYAYGQTHSTELATVKKELEELSKKVITNDHLIQFGGRAGQA